MKNLTLLAVLAAAAAAPAAPATAAVTVTASGRAGALLDRCAHRNVPLSLGRTVEGRLQCAYHGWRYDPEGNCVAVPGLCGEAMKQSRVVPAFAVREADGFVWVFGKPGETPATSPFQGAYSWNRRFMIAVPRVSVSSSP